MRATPQRPSALPSLHASARPSCHCHPWRLARRVATASASGSARTHLCPAGPHAPRRTRALVRALSVGVASVSACRRGKTAQRLCLVQIFPCAQTFTALYGLRTSMTLALQVFVLRLELEPVVSATGRAAVDGYCLLSLVDASRAGTGQDTRASICFSRTLVHAHEA